MQDLIETSGEPDLRIMGLRIWIKDYDDPDADAEDVYGLNWLRAQTQCISENADVRCPGVYLDTHSLTQWLDSLSQFGETGEASLDGIYPNLKIYLKATDRLGHIELKVEITPDHDMQRHQFIGEIDQSYLPSLITSLKNILTRFPVRSAPH